MEEIIRTLEDHKEALNRVMKVKPDLESSTVAFGSRFRLKKFIAIVLWILAGMALLFTTFAFFTSQGEQLITVVTFLISIGVLALLLIRKVSYTKTANIAEAKFEFKGQLRKNRTYTLADYAGAETRRTIKDFPEEFRVKFKTANGIKSYKLADLNMGYARNIEPNYEAVVALWEAIIKQMQSKDNSQFETNNNQEVAPDTDSGL